MKTQERARSYDRSDAQVADDVAAWLRGRLPDEWIATAPGVSVDRDEILITLTLTAPETDGAEPSAVAAARRAASPGFARTPARSGCRWPARPSTATAA